MKTSRSSGGVFVPDPVDLREDFYVAGFEDVTVTKKEYEDDTTHKANLLFTVENDDGEEYTVAFSATAKLSYNPEYGQNTKLTDALMDLGLWETTTEVSEDVLGIEGLADDLQSGDAPVEVEDESDHDAFEEILRVVFAGKDVRLLIETYDRDVTARMAKESDRFDEGDSIPQATVSKLSKIVE